jgi:hypothetical protein
MSEEVRYEHGNSLAISRLSVLILDHIFKSLNVDHIALLGHCTVDGVIKEKEDSKFYAYQLKSTAFTQQIEFPDYYLYPDMVVILMQIPKSLFIRKLAGLQDGSITTILTEEDISGVTLIALPPKIHQHMGQGIKLDDPRIAIYKVSTNDLSTLPLLLANALEGLPEKTLIEWESLCGATSGHTEHINFWKRSVECFPDITFAPCWHDSKVDVIMDLMQGETIVKYRIQDKCRTSEMQKYNTADFDYLWWFSKDNYFLIPMYFLEQNQILKGKSLNPKQCAQYQIDKLNIRSSVLQIIQSCTDQSSCSYSDNYILPGAFLRNAEIGSSIERKEIFYARIIPLKKPPKGTKRTFIEFIDPIFPELQCPHCPKTVKNEANLASHIESFHSIKPIVSLLCPVCHKNLGIAKSAYHHIRKHHPEVKQERIAKNMHCPICNKSLGNVKNPQTHIRRNHPEIDATLY